MSKCIIIGRKNSGKNLFMQELAKADFAIAKSYTTKKQPDDDDKSYNFRHYYISEEDAEIFENKILETEHDGNKYFYTKEEIEKADIICLDVKGLREITTLYPDTAFRIVCIMAANDKRLISAVADKEDKITAEEDFKQLCIAENTEFEEFEDKLTSGNLDIENIHMGHVIVNDFTEKSSIFNWNDDMQSMFRQSKRASKMIEEVAAAGCIIKNNDRYELFTRDPNNTQNIIKKLMSLDMFTEIMLSDNEGLARITSAWLKIKENSFKDN